MKLLSGLALIVASVAFADFSSAQWGLLKERMAKDINNLLSDTVNEGEMEATVLRKGPKKLPVMNCQSETIETHDELNCEVSFRVRTYSGEIETRTCELSYRLKAGTPGLLIRGNSKAFQSCIETLAEGS